MFELKRVGGTILFNPIVDQVRFGYLLCILRDMGKNISGCCKCQSIFGSNGIEGEITRTAGDQEEQNNEYTGAHEKVRLSSPINKGIT